MTAKSQLMGVVSVGELKLCQWRRCTNNFLENFWDLYDIISGWALNVMDAMYKHINFKKSKKTKEQS